MAISPGGVREALFSDEYYTMIWNGRRGFAKVALEAKVVSNYAFFPSNNLVPPTGLPSVKPPLKIRSFAANKN